METPTIKLPLLIITWIAVILIETGVYRACSTGLIALYPAIFLARALQILILLLLIRIFFKNLGAFGLSRHTWRNGFTAGLYWSMVFGGLAALVGAALVAGRINPLTLFALGPPNTRQDIIGLYLTGAIMAPIAEELLFRGITYGFFRRWGLVAGIILSTTVFALFHFQPPAIPITQIIGGMVFCLAYEKEQSLLVPIIIHMLGNAALFTLGIL